MSEMFTRNLQDATRQLRNTNIDIKLPKKRTCNGQNSSSFRGVKLWNAKRSYHILQEVRLFALNTADLEE